MNLEHLEPILFAKEVIEKNENEAVVLCEFATFPTLPMLLEAAAQSSSALADEKKGFLLGAQDVVLHKKIFEKSVKIRIKKEFSSQKLQKFSFVIDEVAKGELSIYVA